MITQEEFYLKSRTHVFHLMPDAIACHFQELPLIINTYRKEKTICLHMEKYIDRSKFNYPGHPWPFESGHMAGNISL